MRRLLLALLLVLYGSPVLANSVILDATTKSLEFSMSASVSIDYAASWVDITTTAFTPGSTEGNDATSGDTTIVAAPAASTQRQIKWVSIRNRSTTTANTIQLMLDVSGTEYVLGPDITLGAGESLRWDAEGELTVFTSSGNRKERSTDASGYGGFTLGFYKVGSTSEAAGVRYYFAGNGGLPGAAVPGAPGVNGWRTDCSAETNAADPAGATQLGAWHLADPASGSYYLTNAIAVATVANLTEIVDVLWYNTGIVVTSTTAQTITLPGAWPARDAEGGSDGEGLMVGIYVTTATTNGSAVTNTTLTYTNSDNTGSRVATMTSFPQTAVAGTLVPFELQAGDRGIKDIASITLGTSYAGGAISLVVYRMISLIPNPTVNSGGVGAPITQFDQPGIRIYNDSCIWFGYIGTTTTATALTGAVTIMER